MQIDTLTKPFLLLLFGILMSLLFETTQAQQEFRGIKLRGAQEMKDLSDEDKAKLLHGPFKENMYPKADFPSLASPITMKQQQEAEAIVDKRSQTADNNDIPKLTTPITEKQQQDARRVKGNNNGNNKQQPKKRRYFEGYGALFNILSSTWNEVQEAVNNEDNIRKRKHRKLSDAISNNSGNVYDQLNSFVQE